MDKKDIGRIIKAVSGSKINRAMLIVAGAIFLVFVLSGRTADAVAGKDDYKLNIDTKRYIASTSKDAGLYIIGIPLDTEETDDKSTEERTADAVEVKRLVRGNPVTVEHRIKKIGDTVYIQVSESGLTGAQASLPGSPPAYSALYIKADNLATSLSDVVRESEIFVRTPTTIYAEASGPEISSLAKKGSCLNVVGYDTLNEDGSVNKYKVQYDTKSGETAEGYVYSKYVVYTQEEADKVYNGNGIYKKVKKDEYGFNLYGGKAKNLDYYPYEKPEIEGKEFCEDARAMYLTCVSAANPKQYIKLIEDTDCNAVVVDIKDGVLAWPAETAKELSPRSYKTAYTTKEKYKKGIDKIRKTGVYMIGRIVVFNDPIYAKDHPEDCIKYQGKTYWPSAYDRDVWEYNVRLAQEAIEEFGFDEIQFDYVRFPETSYQMSQSKKTKFRNKYDEEKGQAIQNFCFYAADQIHEAGAYFSVDVFGESAYGYMTAYGQYWPAISNIVDAISAMPYTDHMGGENEWENPYSTVKRWAGKAKKMQDYLENPAAARTWITGYDTPYWDPTVNYGKKQLKAQVKALKDADLTGGFIPWNAGNSLSKYRQYEAVWNE